ncbi:hypothetical protein RGU11_06620 [Rossellomorea marisflavi]|uniref:hypothetical protein n=1 Tax=Rossellomorea marisflavi TaxID=189381 RepID=UPI002852F7CE|nr:hypothetical protein [Rossellomorea marisflavi]MDR4936039.1 hypothetical protein [Rossellomorea marisflavi]
MTGSIRRISYYVKKVAEWSKKNPATQGDRYFRRGERLHRYKIAMNKKLRGGNQNEN